MIMAIINNVSPECVARKRKRRHKTHQKFISLHHHPIGLWKRLHTQCMVKYELNSFSFMDHDHVILALYNLEAANPNDTNIILQTDNFVIFFTPHRTFRNTSQTVHEHENALNVSLHRHPHRVSSVRHLHKRGKWKEFSWMKMSFHVFFAAFLLLSAMSDWNEC